MALTGTPIAEPTIKVFGMFGAFAAGLYKRGINPFRTGIGMTLLINVGLTFALSRFISVAQFSTTTGSTRSAPVSDFTKTNRLPSAETS